MKVNQNLSILIWLNKPKMIDGLAPIYVRLTIEGRRTQFSLGKKIEPDKWIQKAGMAKGSGQEAKIINNYINTVRGELQKNYNVLTSQNEYVTPEMVRNAYMGVKEEKKTLMELIDYHLLRVQERVDAGRMSKNTKKHFVTTKLKIQSFLRNKYNLSDEALCNLKYQFVIDFEYYFETFEGVKKNTYMKYMSCLKQIIRHAVRIGWLKTNPFQDFKCTYEPANRDILTMEEIEMIYNKSNLIKRLEEVRDIFIFCCFTGFAYADLTNLSPDNISKSVDGEIWLQTYREKTGTKERVMALPIPLEIINKYEKHNCRKIQNRLFPVNSNQKYNAYLKELADICGIKKYLTTHLARHTFATTITLSNGVPIESVSSMLGHKDIRTTQIYARVVQQKVSQDMKDLRKRMMNNPIMKEESKLKIA